jgi:hypothetical protein
VPDQAASTCPPQSAIFRESYLSLFEHPSTKPRSGSRQTVTDLTSEGRSMLLEKNGGDIWRTEIRGAERRQP